MWEQTEHGFEREDKEKGFSLWILPRPSYCDRGHYQWGQNGFSEDLPPSYYFMSSTNAQIEIDEWLDEQLKMREEGLKAFPARESEDPSFDKKSFLKNGWIPHPEKKNSFMKICALPDDAKDDDEPVVVTLDAVATDRGTVYVFNSPNIKHIDYADMFPRLYRNQNVALEEINAFLKWRLEKIPHIETPVKKLTF